MRKQDICLRENKDAEQLYTNAQMISAFYFATRIIKLLFYLNPKVQASSLVYDCTAWFMSDLVENTDDRFSRIAAQICANIYLRARVCCKD